MASFFFFTQTMHRFLSLEPDLWHINFSTDLFIWHLFLEVWGISNSACLKLDSWSSPSHTYPSSVLYVESITWSVTKVRNLGINHHTITDSLFVFKPFLFVYLLKEYLKIVYSLTEVNFLVDPFFLVGRRGTFITFQSNAS